MALTAKEKMKKLRDRHDIRPVHLRGPGKDSKPVVVPHVPKRPGYRNANPPRTAGGAANGKTSKAIIAHRQRLVAKYYLQGMSQMEVVAALAKNDQVACSQTTVSLDLRAIMKAWKAECISDFEEQRLKEVEGLNALEVFAQEELYNSRYKTVKVKPGEDEKDHQVRTEVVRKEASVKWFEMVLKVRAERVELLGLVQRVVNNNTTQNLNIMAQDFWAAVQAPPTGEDPIEAKILSVKTLNAKEQG